MITLRNNPNSFVTFYNLTDNVGVPEYVTDSDCGIQKDFCYPIFDVLDVSFQVDIVSTEIINNVTFYRVPSVGSATIINDVFTSIVPNGTQNGVPIYNVFVNFNTSSLLDGIFDGDCFSLMFVVGVETRIFVSNQCFKKIADKCLTTRLIYYNAENAFGFLYRTYNVPMPPPLPPIPLPTINTIRIPMYFKEPAIASEKNVYVRSDGSRKLLSARLSKKYKVLVDHVPEETHQCLVVALNHDSVKMFPDNFSNGIEVRFEDEYNNNFPEVMQNVSQWSADFAIFETPFNNYNSNCS